MDETVVTTFEQCQKITFLPGVKFKNISPNSYKNGRPRDVGIPHICHFSPPIQFWLNFFPHKGA